MNYPHRTGSSARDDGRLTVSLAGRSGSGETVFFDIVKMRLEYIPPALVAKQWSNIHKGVTK
jgi:hypothetical protein